MSPRELSEVTINIDRENSGTVKRRIKPKSTTCFIAFNPQFDGKQEVLLKGIEKLQASLPQVKVQLVLYGDDTYPGDLDLSQYSVLKFPEVDRLAKAYNQAVKHCDSDYLIFCRAGLVLKVADYQATLAALQDFDAVAPYSMEARLTDSPNTTESLPLQRKERIMTTHFGTHFFAIRRSVFEYLGGWDQGFSDSLLGSFAFSYILTRLCSTLSLHRSRLQEDLPVIDVSIRQETSYWEEISSFSGASLLHYRKRISEAYHHGSTTEPIPSLPRFVLAITTYNRKEYLQNCLESWLATRTTAASWELIIADDGSSDGTLSYLRQLQLVDTKFTLIENWRSDIIHQTNTILKQLEQTSFDLCFKCDDDVLFKEKGWDQLYWQAIQRTGYEHLIYYNLAWRPASTKSIPHIAGQLVSYCDREFLQGAFFTVTPAVLKEVGFFDAQQLGFRGYEHNDFSIRCCRAGYNSLENPFDVQGSNKYIDLQGHIQYIRAMSSSLESKLHQERSLAQKRRVLDQNRIYIPFHQIHRNLDQLTEASQEDQQIFTVGDSLYRMADGRWVRGRGLSGWLGSLLKNIYNLCLRNSWFWGPRLIKRMGLILLRIGKDLVNIDH